MKEKLLVVSIALSVLVSTAALAAFLSQRAQAAAPAQPADAALKAVGQDAVTRVYSFRSEGHLCFVATTIGGSGISIACP